MKQEGQTKPGGKKDESKVYEFDAVIRKVDGIDGAYINFLGMSGKNLGADGCWSALNLTGLLTKASSADKFPGHIVGVRKDIRAQIGKQPGDEVHVRLQERISEKKR
ncbi:MAG: DUF1905 domain-containing protein [Holdemania massiliensis]